MNITQALFIGPKGMNSLIASRVSIKNLMELKYPETKRYKRRSVGGDSGLLAKAIGKNYYSTDSATRKYFDKKYNSLKNTELTEFLESSQLFVDDPSVEALTNMLMELADIYYQFLLLHFLYDEREDWLDIHGDVLPEDKLNKSTAIELFRNCLSPIFITMCKLLRIDEANLLHLLTDLAKIKMLTRQELSERIVVEREKIGNIEDVGLKNRYRRQLDAYQAKDPVTEHFLSRAVLENFFTSEALAYIIQHAQQQK